ncbi:MAG: SusC/RagA family TonB-linked outer membrane protein [Chitinophagaceae bacterium]
MKKSMLLLVCLCLSVALLAQRTITGKVVDERGNPVSSASVQVKGTSTGTVTGVDGNYSLVIPENARQLEFSYVGMTPQLVDIRSGTSTYSVTLLPVSANMEEVVVTGISRARRSEYAGAASKVTDKELRNVPVGSFDQMLQGRAPGLTVLSGNGQPGAAASLQIRGTTSITGGSNPLYVVDGIAVEGDAFQGINPNDIASIDVLKDATSAALYGSRGAAGVIVVTTKRGSSGKMKLGFSGQYGTKFRPEFKYDMMSSSELLVAQEALGLQLPNSSLTAWGNFPTLPGWQYSRQNPNKLVGGVLVPKTDADFAFGDSQLDSIRNINTNWYDYFYRNGTFSNNEISFSGGTGRTRIYSNLGIYNEEGINDPSDMKRVTLRTNMDYADEKLTFALSSNIGYTRRNFQTNALNAFAAFVNPFFVPMVTPGYIGPFAADGEYNVGTGIVYSAPTQLDKTKYDKVYNDQIKATLSAAINYNFTNNIYAGVTGGIDFRHTQNTTYNDPRVFDTYTNTNVRTRTGSISDGYNRLLTLNARAFAGYKNTFAADHDVDFTVYGEYIAVYSKNLNGTAFGIDPRRPNTFAAVTAGNGANQLFQTITGGKSQNKLQSVMGTGRYTFQKKYTITGSYRYDGTSKLPEDNRFKGFWSVGGIWDVMKENFMSNVGFLNTLRVKASYGQSANADNFPYGDFGYLPLYNTQANLTSGQIGIVPDASAPGNPNADWEYTNTLNIGIEFAMLRNKLYGDIQVYDKRTNNLFAQLSLSATGGPFGSIDVNAGKMFNRGIEYSINYDVIRTRDLTWTLNVNGAYNKNEITDLGGITSFELGTSLVSVGKPIGSHFEVKWAGVDASTGAPLYYDLDGKVTPVYSAANRVQDYGTSIPPLTGGFGTSLRFKGFDFSAFFSYAADYYLVNNWEFFLESPNFLGQGINQAKSLNFWQKPGDVASSASPLYQNQFTSKLIQDASFLRLRTVTLSYTMPSSVVERLRHVSNVRFYILGQNLLTWTKWKGLDPENDQNVSLGEYPNPRAITAGIDITF